MIMFAIFTFILLSVTLLLWLINIFIISLYNSEAWEPISPLRWILSVSIPLFMAHHGLRKKSLNGSGAKTGFIVGFVMTLSNYCFMASLMAFYLAGSKVTKWRSVRKKKLEEDFKEGGQRNWLQVICNGGVAAELALIYSIDSGCMELPVDFVRRYSASWISMAVLGAISCSSGDTFSSEIGSVVGSSDPWLITSLRKVPRGTNGGVSIAGLISSIVGGFIIGLTYFVVLFLTVNAAVWQQSPPQWPIIFVGCLCGFFGSIVDSFLGAVFQFSGINKETGCIVESPGAEVKSVSGIPILNNHSVNLLSSVIIAFLSPWISLNIWQYFISRTIN